MKWIFLFVCVFSSIFGDSLSAKGMSEDDRDAATLQGLSRVPKRIVTDRLVLIGLACNAISFFALMALLSVASVSFAVPATAIAYLFKTAVAEFYLHEDVGWRRWTGAVLVSIGVYLLTV